MDAMPTTDAASAVDAALTPDTTPVSDQGVEDASSASDMEPDDSALPVADAAVAEDATPITLDMASDAAPIAPFELTSTGFEEGEQIPYEYTCFGEDVQPKLSWRNPPEGAQSYAIVLFDETIDFVHWVAYNIPGDVSSLRRGASDNQQLPEGVREARAYGGGPFHGPCTPPPGPHTYVFRIYALDAEAVPFSRSGRISSAQVDAEFAANRLGVATLTGTCQPPP